MNVTFIVQRTVVLCEGKEELHFRSVPVEGETWK